MATVMPFIVRAPRQRSRLLSGVYLAVPSSHFPMAFADHRSNSSKPLRRARSEAQRQLLTILVAIAADDVERGLDLVAVDRRRIVILAGFVVPLLAPPFELPLARSPTLLPS